MTSDEAAGLTRAAIRVLISVVAFGLLCALGAAGAMAGGSSNAVGSGKAAQDKACLQSLGKKRCNAPERYRVDLSGTIDYRHGGTETFEIKGVVKRLRKHVPFLRADYTQARGTTMTLTYRDIGMELHEGCSGGLGGFAKGNAPSQTIPLPPDDYGVYFSFRLTEGEYELSTSHPGEDPGVPGTATCDDGGGSVPVVFGHRFTGLLTGLDGRPRRVVKGSHEETDLELYHYRYSWKLTAKKSKK